MRIFKIFIFLLAYMTYAVCASQETDSIFWEAKFGGKKVYILGITHNGYASQYPLRSKILESFETSKVYVTESIIPYVTGEEAQHLLIDKFKPTSGVTMNSLLLEKGCGTLAKEENFESNLKMLFGPEPRILEQSPRAAVFAVFTKPLEIDPVEAAKLGLALNVEYFLSQKGERGGKRHLFLDPELWDAIDALSPAETCSLAVGLTSMRSSPDYAIKNGAALMNRQRDLWSKGNSEELAKTTFSWPNDFSEKHLRAEKKWMRLRNEIMAKKILTMSRNESSAIFVILGAGHLGGTDGIIPALQNLGFVVTPQ